MKRLVSTALAVTLLLSLGALAVLARGGGDILAPTRAAPVALAASQPQTAAGLDAPATGAKYNTIALPIDAGYQKASALVTAIQTSTGNTVSQLLKWDPNQGADGAYMVYEPGHPLSTDFDLIVGDALFALLTGTGTEFSLVGKVPPEHSVTFPLVGNPAGCHYNFISIPLDMGSITTAQKLADSVGDVVQALSWDPAQGPDGAYYVRAGNPFSVNFAVKIGYPYFLCLSNAATKTWPLWP